MGHTITAIWQLMVKDIETTLDAACNQVSPIRLARAVAVCCQHKEVVDIA